MTAARYDGYADWYDNWRAPQVPETVREVTELLGPGSGLCLDLGCGTGLFLDALAATGRTVIGVDLSADQLRFAARRSARVMLADATALPFADGTFPAVVAMWISTDVDYPAVLAEAARVLQDGGTFLSYGAHPCFNGPHVEWLPDGGLRAHPTYRQPGWQRPAPWWGTNVRVRVGMRQHTLADILNAFIGTDLALEHVAESGDRAVPNTLAIRARKTTSHSGN